ncbi:unnamed protein product [Brachionus calyciflorus]|uniref:Uncharacterized protein n=1 Tax=Brachionus calyciflorus TaxID=104777 RepID=A0A814QQ35_9BILA|nr:unnamed protein product [Brachionus calyciflorus]
MNSFKFMIHVVKRISIGLAIVFSVLSLCLSWIGFSVPDWLFYEDVNLVKKKFGLWTFCYQNRTSRYPVYKCDPWPSAQDQLPDFVRTTQVLMTLACVCLTFGVIVGILSVIFKNGYAKILPLLAGFLCLLTFMLIVIGISVFGSDYAAYAEKLAGRSYFRRWGYWIYLPVTFLLLFATFFYPISFWNSSSESNEFDA